MPLSASLPEPVRNRLPVAHPTWPSPWHLTSDGVLFRPELAASADAAEQPGAEDGPPFLHLPHLPPVPYAPLGAAQHLSTSQRKTALVCGVARTHTTHGNQARRTTGNVYSSEVTGHKRTAGAYAPTSTRKLPRQDFRLSRNPVARGTERSLPYCGPRFSYQLRPVWIRRRRWACCRSSVPQRPGHSDANANGSAYAGAGSSRRFMGRHCPRPTGLL